ncbi:MAG: hypothetical protein NT022_07550 [Deltaproteobacteria bacterium]|nr:hypothetical protein [Deltaproteobacteria bacterium]
MRQKNKRSLSDKEIDSIVIAQADNDSAWERPSHIRRKKPTAVALASELAARAAFFARLHREANVEDWLTRIIQERVDLEEAAYVALKRDLSSKTNV